MESVKAVSIQNAAHYNWGQNSDGWHLLKQDDLSVIEEKMPPGSFEQLHFHKKAQQLFYILSGSAVFTIDQKSIALGQGESVHIPATVPHRISNEGNTDLRFLVISVPRSHGDRVNL
jgi:mannose-6-phosphate isomerase-like protein (cupin superfamily)